MKFFKRMLLLIIAAMLAFPLHVNAEDASRGADAVIRLDAVVVSATRNETSVFDVPQNVTVLGHDDIMASPFERVEDIVRSVPGIYNFRHYGQQTNGTQSPLMMRGVGKNRVLILVDGVPQNDNFNNAIAWVAWGHIPKKVIERIEIVRGPSSALYGSEGLGGVIHIITKQPKKIRKTSISMKAGSGETYGGDIYHSQKFERFGFMVSGGYEESDGFYMADPVESYNTKRYRDAYKGFGKVTYDIDSQSDVSLSALYYDHETNKGREFFYDELQLNQYWLNYSRQTDALGIKGLAFFNHSDKTAYQDTASDSYTSINRIENLPSTYTWGVDLQGTLPIWQDDSLTIGTSFKESSWEYDEDYPASTRDAGAEGKQQFVSPFVNLNISMFDDSLIANVGARYDWIKTFDGANWDTQPSGGLTAYNNKYDTQHEENFSPKIGLAYHPDSKSTLRASAGKGFRAPSLFELYKVHVRSGGTYYRDASPTLKPEEIWSYDVGGERLFFDTLLSKVTFYQSLAKDYIGDRLTGTSSFAGGTKTRYEYVLDNISEVDIYGVEIEAQWRPVSRFTFSANYTYNISKIKEYESYASLEGNYLPNDPRHNFHFGIQFQDPNLFNLSVFTNYYAKIYYDNENTLETGNYCTVDVGISKRFFDQLTFYVNGENIFDKEYTISRSASRADTVSPGAVYSAGVTFEF